MLGQWRKVRRRMRATVTRSLRILVHGDRIPRNLTQMKHHWVWGRSSPVIVKEQETGLGPPMLCQGEEFQGFCSFAVLLSPIGVAPPSTRFSVCLPFPLSFCKQRQLRTSGLCVFSIEEVIEDVIPAVNKAWKDLYKDLTAMTMSGTMLNRVLVNRVRGASLLLWYFSCGCDEGLLLVVGLCAPICGASWQCSVSFSP